MEVLEHKSLKNFNTFGIDCKARYFVSVSDLSELEEALKLGIHENLLVLGGGSNMLLTRDVDALVVHLDLRGIEVISEDESEVKLKVMAGENWHDLVMYCVDKNWGGIENLSLIPGNVGTAPIQNIGAYGVELKDVFESCTALEIDSLESKTFSKDDCKFEYRNSLFKNEAKGRYIITSVTIRLTNKDHLKSTSYGAIRSKLAENNISEPSIKDISEAVISIRRSKLPDPKEIGNSGSFFKNPVVSKDEFEKFQSANPMAPFYEVSSTQFKIPAGWLIEKAGFKGKRFGDAGVHKNQALVLVNHDAATGKEIWELALSIQKKVYEQFGILIEPEVNVI